jgi:Fe-S-cluster containining protein
VTREVPCGSCRACCYLGVELLAGDDVDFYVNKERVQIVDERGGAVTTKLILRRREDGACAYLGPDGCTIYENRPISCREFDCRDWLALTPEEDPICASVMAAARRLPCASS